MQKGLNKKIRGRSPLPVDLVVVDMFSGQDDDLAVVLAELLIPPFTDLTIVHVVDVGHPDQIAAPLLVYTPVH